MMISLVVVLLLMLESTVGNDPFQQCCPEDDVFVRMHGSCNTSHSLVLGCENVTTALKVYNSYWLRESDSAAVIGSEFVGVVLARDSFCVANVTYEKYYKNETKILHSEGIVFCEDAEFHATYLSAEPLSYTICILISAIGCFLTVITYMVVPSLRRELLNKCLICALLCFTFTYLLVAVTILQVHRLPHRFCAYQLLFTLYWITASVFWTNVISFDIWRSVVFKRFPLNEAQLLKVYYFWGFGMPLLLCFFGFILEGLENDRFGLGCYVDSVVAIFMHVIPSVLLLLFNLLYFIWTLCKLWGQDSPSRSPGIKPTRLQRLRYKCVLYVKLLLVMGIPWIIRIGTMFLPTSAFTHILENIMLVLQGFFVFLLLVVFRKKALLGLAQQFAKWGCPCPYVTTNLAVTLNDEGDDDDDDDDHDDRVAQNDAVELNTQINLAS